ncbi:MAG: trehalose-6-phosphate synthase [Chloroflexota bacterium]|nr:trehalose-6-phosphate synthase [Chloroflexota bacterium]
MKDLLGDTPLVIVSNREPYIHEFSGDTIRCVAPASGLTTALDPVMRACGGTWIAHGSGTADQKVVDADDKVAVPPEEPCYHLRRVWLTKEQEEGYYYGFANQALWPLCHVAYTRPLFNEAHWNRYREVNELFADAVCQEVGDHRAFVFVQDYHLALLPRILKQRLPKAIVAQFWHIPWPNPEVFRILPWQEDVLDGLLGNDLLGFHIQYHCNNFLETVDRTLEARVDRERHGVVRGGHRTVVRPFPISIDFDRVSQDASSGEVTEEMDRLIHALGLHDRLVGFGLDRFDYTKGIPERLRAYGRFLEKYPEHRGRVVFIQAGTQSRIHIDAYQRLNTEVDDLVEELNWKYGQADWQPIVLMRNGVSQISLLALRRLAHFCVVSSLHDGMNLVAKEFVAARSDEDGVLILSPFTGAARELTDALLVNPYATDRFADVIKEAVDMPPEERRLRMRRMRKTVQENNVYRWAEGIVRELSRLGERV